MGCEGVRHPQAAAGRAVAPCDLRSACVSHPECAQPLVAVVIQCMFACAWVPACRGARKRSWGCVRPSVSGKEMFSAHCNSDAPRAAHTSAARSGTPAARGGGCGRVDRAARGLARLAAIATLRGRHTLGPSGADPRRQWQGCAVARFDLDAPGAHTHGLGAEAAPGLRRAGPARGPCRWVMAEPVPEPLLTRGISMGGTSAPPRPFGPPSGGGGQGDWAVASPPPLESQRDAGPWRPTLLRARRRTACSRALGAESARKGGQCP